MQKLHQLAEACTASLLDVEVVDLPGNSLSGTSALNEKDSATIRLLLPSPGDVIATPDSTLVPSLYIVLTGGYNMRLCYQARIA